MSLNKFIKGLPLSKDALLEYMQDVLSEASFPELRRDDYPTWCHVVFNISDPDTWLHGKQRSVLEYISQYENEIKLNPTQWQFNILVSFFDPRSMANPYISVDLEKMKRRIKDMTHHQSVKFFNHLKPETVEKLKFILEGNGMVEFIRVK